MTRDSAVLAAQLQLVLILQRSDSGQVLVQEDMPASDYVLRKPVRREDTVKAHYSAVA
jgi:hypothetical protein